MAIDQYVICPCGSGKKIKFCKCFESIGELEKVMKMVQGGQMVAALDRLNQIFKQHPTAAWTLAIKGRLLLSMNELPNLEENAERFIRLQPSNPLALAQKAAAQTGQGKLTEAAHSILQSLAESGQSVDSLIIEICGILALSLARSGNLLSARMFATIALMASQDEMLQRLPRLVLEELNGSSEFNLLLKTLPTTIHRPANVSWGERYDEAQTLLYSNQILASESKLEALDRQHPNEPSIMMSLFVCSIWRADVDAQARILAKVSEALSTDPEKSTRLLAVSWLLGSETQGLDVPVHSLVYEIQDADQAVLELTADSHVEPLTGTDLRSIQNADGIHPRAAFVVLDKPPVESQPVTREIVRQLPQIRGMMFVFGRQTDKPPQVEIRQIYSYNLNDVKEMIKAAVPSAVLTSPENSAADQQEVLPLGMSLSPRIYLPRSMREQPGPEDVIEDMLWHHLSEHVVRYELKCLNGKSLAQLKDDPATLKQRTAFARILQGEMTMLRYREIVDRFSLAIGVEPLAMLTPQNDEELELLPAFDLPLVDMEQLNNETLFYYFERCSHAGIEESANNAAKKIVALDSDDQETQEMIMRAYVSLISSEQDHLQAIQYGRDALVWCNKRNIPDASILLTTLPRYIFAQDSQGFTTAIQQIQAKYGSNPEVMTHLTRMLIDLGILNPDGSPRRMAPPPSSAKEGLWTGNSPAPAAAPGTQAESAPTGGGSKLWLPGMD